MSDTDKVTAETPTTVIKTTNVELKEVLEQAVTEIREDMHTALTESANQAAEILHQAVEVMQQAAQAGEAPPDRASEKNDQELPNLTATSETTPIELPEPVKEAIADQAQAEVARATEVAMAGLSQAIEDARIGAATIPAPLTPAEDVAKIEATHQPLNNTISLVKTQSMVTYAILFLIIIGLSAYIVFDKINQRQDQLAAVTPLSAPAPFSLDSILYPQSGNQDAISDINEQIIKAQKESLELKPFSDTNLKASIAKTIRESNKISELIQSHVVAIKRSEKISDRNAIAKAFLADDIVPVVLAELPVEIQNVPRAEEFIKDTLKDISECVKLLYNDKEFRR